MRMPGLLPIVLRWENANGDPRMNFTCQCGEAVAAYAKVEGGSAEARCPKCHTFVQIRASREYLAEGGKPGSGK